MRKDLAEELLHTDTRKQRCEGKGIPALFRLDKLAQRSYGQAGEVHRFLLGLYTPYEWPYALNGLRGLDVEILDGCLKVVEMDALVMYCPIEAYLSDGQRIFQALWRLERPE